MFDDFRDVLTELVRADAQFLVVGAHALGVHGVPRATLDLDLWIARSPENAARVHAALSRFGAPLESLGIAESDFLKENLITQLGVPPVRIDVLTSVSGVTFDEAWRDRTEGEVEGVRVPVMGLKAFIANKRASGRKKDLADLESLGVE